ncbi:hypothetical protein RI367_006940 [Sorochytrium milnesiophthora]
MAERVPHAATLGDDDATPAAGDNNITTAESTPFSPTTDDEMIARLMQQDFDNQLRIAEQQRRQQQTQKVGVGLDELERLRFDQARHIGTGPPPAHLVSDMDHGLRVSTNSAHYANSSSVSSPVSSTETSASLPPFISEAKTAVKNTISDIVSLIKQETKRAGQPEPPLADKKQQPSPSSASSDAKVSVKRNPAASQPLPSKPTLDFTNFLDDMRDRRAYPLTKYFRSFLREFSKRSWTVTEQQKIIHDFTNFMAQKIAENEVWAGASEEELDNACEGMEKLLMNKLHAHTFSPSTTDDAVKDEVLHKKICILRWMELKHLDINISPQTSESFIKVARQELLKMNDYKAPRDKLICILNCCKVIFGLLKHAGTETNADMFLPLLIFVVIQANPPHLISNVQYISRFRNPAKLSSESGYYLTNLMGAISFIETLDVRSLSITPEEFDRNVERTMFEMEAEHEAMRSLPPPVTAASVADSDSAHGDHAQPFISQERLQVLASKAKKPLNVIGRWFSEVQSQTRDVVVSPSQAEAPTSHDLFGSEEAKAASPLPEDPTGMHNTVAAAPSTPQLTADEQALLEDYELQMAMAMSISLEEGKQQWETSSVLEMQPSEAPEAVDESFRGFSIQDSVQALSTTAAGSEHAATEEKTGASSNNESLL